MKSIVVISRSQFFSLRFPPFVSVFFFHLIILCSRLLRERVVGIYVCINVVSITYIDAKVQNERTTTRRDTSFWFFFFLPPHRSPTVVAKSAQKTGSYLMSGNWVATNYRKGRRIRCNRPMSTVQHLCPFHRLSFFFWRHRHSVVAQLLSRIRGERTDREKEKGKRNACRFRLVRRTRSVY